MTNIVRKPRKCPKCDSLNTIGFIDEPLVYVVCKDCTHRCQTFYQDWMCQNIIPDSDSIKFTYHDDGGFKEQ